MSYEFKEEPLELVVVKEDGTLEITENGVDFLSALKNQSLSILCLIGPSKSGKSFLASTLLGKTSLFNTNTKTKGIWVWGKPIDLPNNAKLLLLDSQCIDKNDPDFSSQKLFLISILLSTCLVYVSKKDISEEEINLLSFFVENSKKILVHPQSNNTKKNANNVELLSEYFPQLIWALNDFTSEKDANIYLEEMLNKNTKASIIKKLFQKRNCVYLSSPTNSDEKNKNLDKENYASLSSKYIKELSQFYENIKTTIKTKKVNNLNLDGDSLFGVLQNYLDSFNDDESPVILQALDNVLLSKGKFISDKIEDKFKEDFTKKFDGKFPVSFSELYKGFFELQDKLLINFANEVEGTLTVQQVGDYIVKLSQRMRTEMENVFDTNKEYYDEWVDMIYKDIEKSLNGISFTKIEDLKYFMSQYMKSFQSGLSKFIDMPNTEFTKSILGLMVKIFDDFVSKRMLSMSDTITEMYINYVKESMNNIDNLNANIKRLNDQAQMEKNMFEYKNKEKNEINRKYLELETKYDKLLREMKSKEKEYENNISIEIQKFKQMEAYYNNQIKDKDSSSLGYESKIQKLNKELSETNKESNNKITELNKENLKLQFEIQRLKQEEKKRKVDGFEGDGMNLQSQFKHIQNTFNDFKESLDKLNRENEIVFKTKEIEFSSRELENKSRSWIDEIRQYKEEQIKAMSENFEKVIQKLKNNLDEVNFELTKLNYTLSEQTQNTENWKLNFNEANKKIDDLNNIKDSQDYTIKSQNDNIKLLEENVEELTKRKEDLELQLNQNIVNFKMKEDEVETLVTVIRELARGKKEKYEHSLQKLSPETKESVMDAVKGTKLVKSLKN